ncbi:MAG: outer membrane protein OmpA-like peptidoglycan-associated protein [Vicingaceae bacterium]|jgi:outer membrane protein OmpA-like peptidoglycan-associated protein
MKRGVALMALLFTFSTVFSQDDWSCSKPNKKAQKLYGNAQQLNFKGEDSYRSLIEAVKLQEDYAEALSVLAYINSKKLEQFPENLRIQNRVKSYYEKTRDACPAYRNYEASFWLAKFYYHQRDYNQAYTYVTEYLSKSKSKNGKELEEAQGIKKRIEKYKELFKQTVPFNPNKVPGVSTAEDEYLPMLSPDNQFLFFTRKTTVDSKSVFGEQEKELFFQSRKRYDGTYSKGIPMETPFNSGTSYQGGSSISIDNKLLFITIVSPSFTRDGRSFSNGDIYYSDFYDGNWSALKSIGSHINGQFTWEGQPSISADNQTLYFASAREASETHFGGMDLYKVERLPNGNWGNPINLGPKINTSGNEKSPFMHSDSYTLYFSSDGHPGVGGQDIFFSHIDKFKEFSSPVNIGVPINTEEDEVGFMVSTDGKYGYFSSNALGEGLDIYNFELPEYARPDEVAFIKGAISSKDPNAAKGMKIELKNTTTNEITKGVVDEKTGEYVAVIRAKEKEDVMMMAKKNGYAFTSQYINSDKDVIGRPKRVEAVEFKPIETGQTYQINNINFTTDSYELNSQVVNILNEFIVFLVDNPSVKVAIHGHTDNVGDSEENLLLSTNRAKAVFNYLIIQDVDPTRLKFKGFGSTKPIASNSTDEGRAKNRRTEFVILSK